MEDKKDKKIRLLSDEVDRLCADNEAMRKENAELQGKVEAYENDEKLIAIQTYEQDLKKRIEQISKLQSLYEKLIEKQKKFITREKGKYKKATNKAITELNKSILS